MFVLVNCVVATYGNPILGEFKTTTKICFESFWELNKLKPSFEIQKKIA